MSTQNATYYHLILDKSGSMNSHYEQTLEGLNEKIHSIKAIQQRNPEVQLYVSLTLFSDQPELVFENVPATYLSNLTENDYVVDGMTALLDAIGTTVSRMEYAHGREIRENNANAMVVIFTDGHENASRIFTFKQIAAKIKELEATGKWSFAFVGADIDAWQAAQRMNFKQSKVYSSRKTEVKDTLSLLSEQLEMSIKLKKDGKTWDGFK